MKIAFIIRATYRTVPGGDTVQIEETAKGLRKLGVTVDILPTNSRVNYDNYDLLHFFNIGRPADILYHTRRTNKPFAVSTILVDYAEYDKFHRKGITGKILGLFSPSANEYIKTIARWLTGKDRLQTKSYIWKGQRRSILNVLKKASLLLPNSVSEWKQVKEQFGIEKPFAIIPNGIASSLFFPDPAVQKDETLVLCAARIEGRKNQMNLVKAMNDKSFNLMLAGAAAPNQKKYFKDLKKIASSNIIFSGQLAVETLLEYYKRAKVHVLPSWHETCGLSSLEAAAMGCNIVITDRGYIRDYFGDMAFYCDPADPKSIFDAIQLAARSGPPLELQKKILSEFTWEKAAVATLAAYKKIIPT